MIDLPLTLDQYEAERICVIKPSALGDVVQSLPILPALRERYPSAHISWVINRTLSDLVLGHPHLDEAIPFDRQGSWAQWSRLLGVLHSRQFDLVFDLQGLMRTGIMTAATGAQVRVGLQTAREGAHLASNVTIPNTGRDIPAHQRYWRVAEALGLGESRRQTLIRISKQDSNWAEGQLSQLKGMVLGIHPGAGWTTKRWPIEKYAVVGCKFMRMYGGSVVILGSPDEAELGEQLEALFNRFVPSKPILNLSGKTSLKQLSTMLSAVDLLATNDSGPMHLAAGLGTPVLGIFTCTSPEISGPPGEQHELIATRIPCAASYKKVCPHSGADHLACMEELSTDTVCESLVRLIEKNKLTHRAA